MLNINSMVVTNRCNYGRVVSIGSTTAKVKIGYKIHEIELYNLTDVTDGLHLKVTYSIEDKDAVKDLLFIKHGTILFDMYNSDGTAKLLKTVEHALSKKLDVPIIKILKIEIP